MKIDRTFIEILKRFLEPLLSMKMIAIKATMPVLIGSIVSIAMVYLLKEITDNLSNWFSADIKNLLYIFIWLSIFYYSILIIMRNWAQWTLWPSFKNFFYTDFIKKYVYIDNNEAEKLWTWKLIAMLDNAIMSWSSLLVTFFEEVVPNVLFIIFSFIFIFFISPSYFFIILSCFIIIFYLTYIFQLKAKKYRDERKDVTIDVTRNFVKILMSKFEVLQNNKIEQESLKITNKLQRYLYLNLKVNDFNVISEVWVKFLIDSSKILIILMFGVWLWGKIITFWEFVSLMSIIYIFDQILTKSVSTYINFTKLYVDIEKVWDFFDSTSTIKWYDEWKDFKYSNWDIRIENLTYSYTKDQEIFEDFCLDIKGGKITALVWESWSWKSTLVKLIAWYISPDNGTISVDSQDLSTVSLKTYYKNIWYLTQDPWVFDGSILENLTYAVNRELKEEEIDRVLKLSKAEFIYELPLWLKTQIWERWVRLSWGQKQRLAIAKIFLKNPSIIILDEPTSALDSFSEEQITNAMHNLFKGRTVIIIAHRLQTVKWADEILFFDKWEIIERWSHKDLIQLNWRYTKMLELQSWF